MTVAVAALVSTVIAPSGEKIATVWWVDRYLNEDAYCINVRRYHEPVQDRADGDRWATWAEYLDGGGRWHVAEENTECEPALRLSGLLVHTLLAIGALDRAEIVDALTALAARILPGEAGA